MLTEHSAIVFPVIFRKSGLPPAVEVKDRWVMSDGPSLRSSFYSLLSFYVYLTLLSTLYVRPHKMLTHTQKSILVK